MAAPLAHIWPTLRSGAALLKQEALGSYKIIYSAVSAQDRSSRQSITSGKAFNRPECRRTIREETAGYDARTPTRYTNRCQLPEDDNCLLPGASPGRHIRLPRRCRRRSRRRDHGTARESWSFNTLRAQGAPEERRQRLSGMP